MNTRRQIEKYRAERPHLELLGRSRFPDDLVVADLSAEADCTADVPLAVKDALAPLAEETGFFHARGLLLPTIMLAPSTILVNFDASPHGGSWKPLPDHGGEPAITVRSFFHHSIVGSAAGAWGYFANKTVLESTFIVHKSGYFWQCMSLGEQADAQYHANDWAASAETEDDGDPNTDPWTAAQIEALCFLTWEVDRLCPSMQLRILPTWDAAGFGFHSQFGAPSNLTPSAGKTCPGTIRKQQWSQIVAPTIMKGGVAPVLDADDKKYIADQVAVVQDHVEEQGLRRLGAYLAAGIEGQQFARARPGYEWIASPSTYTLARVGKTLDALVATGLKLDPAALRELLEGMIGDAVGAALAEHPVMLKLDPADRQQIITDAAKAAGQNVADRMAT